MWDIHIHIHTHTFVHTHAHTHTHTHHAHTPRTHMYKCTPFKITPLFHPLPPTQGNCPESCMVEFACVEGAEAAAAALDGTDLQAELDFCQVPASRRAPPLPLTLVFAFAFALFSWPLILALAIAFAFAL